MARWFQSEAIRSNRENAAVDCSGVRAVERGDGGADAGRRAAGIVSEGPRLRRRRKAPTSPARRSSRRRSWPAAPVASASFFVEGRQVCEVREAPFVCSWDAGKDAREWQVRLTVNFKDGSPRIIKDPSHQRTGFRRHRRGRCRSGHGDRHQRRQVRAGIAAKGFPGLGDGRPQTIRVSSRKMCRSSCSSRSTSAAA